MRITAFFVLLCLYSTQADVTPPSLDEREEALETPFKEEGILEQSKSDKTPHTADESAEFIVLLKRIDQLESEMNDIVERFASCTKGLSDEKILRKHEIDDIRNDIDIFKQSVEEGIKNKLKEATDTCKATTKELQGQLEGILSQLKERIKSEIKEEIRKEHQDAIKGLDQKLNSVCGCNDYEMLEILEEKGGGDEPQQKGCPETWKQHGDMCYIYEFDELMWTPALLKCQHYGGTLIEIKDPETNDFVKKHLYNKELFFVGGKKNDQGVWLWEESGDEIRYPDWLYGKERSHRVGCLAVFREKRLAVNCGFKRPYICQKKIGLV